MRRLVTRVVVTVLEPDAHNPEPHLVEYMVDGELEHHRHDSKAAARRHVGNLLKQIPAGLTRDDVLEVRRR